MADMDDDAKIFPQRLMEILSEERNQQAICWLPHGRAFMVRDRNLFAETVMPRYFPRNAKYSSFTRKLNRWGFVRVSSGPEIGAHYHEFFLRDKPQLAAQMFCKNARSKLAMSTDAPAPKPAPEPVVAPPPAQATQTIRPQQSIQLPPDIPLALLEALSKGPASSAMESSPTPSRLLQQSQYANLLLERQIQILQQEQAKLLLLGRQQVMHEAASKPRADELQLRQLVDLRNRQKSGRGPTNHRASAA